MITLLMSVYYRERPTNLSTALESILLQTEMPEEIILVKDGPLGDDLEAVIDAYKDRLNIRIIPLTQNLGLSAALNVGMKHASHPWVMRFDTDDICLPHRVSRQRALILSGQYDLFGSLVEEFSEGTPHEKSVRPVPLHENEILEFCRTRNPFNHMSVCFRRDLASACGGYPQIPFMEDYGLWVKMLMAGARVMNDPEVLVRARGGNEMLARRGGFHYCRSEIKLQMLMIGCNFKPLWRACKDGGSRCIFFLLPDKIKAFFYYKLLRRTGI